MVVVFGGLEVLGMMSHTHTHTPNRFPANLKVSFAQEQTAESCQNLATRKPLYYKGSRGWTRIMMRTDPRSLMGE